MANIKFSRKVFEKEIGKLDEEMQNKIALFGTTLESFDDKEIELEIFPDRPDLLSYQGFKRGFLAFLGKKTGLKEYKVFKPEKNYSVKVGSSVKDVRPFTACAIVKGLKLNDEKIKEIVDLQEKLHMTIGRKRKKLAIGIYPLEKIKLPIKYVAFEPDRIKFRPLESEREMSGLDILNRHPTGRDYAHLLAGKMKFPIFVDSAENVLSMPPIINSELTGRVNEKTKDVFVECSGFDMKILNQCLNIIVTSLAEMGGRIYSMKVGSEITPNLTPEKIKLNLESVNRLLGLNFKGKEIKKLLEKMGHGVKGDFVQVPSWRVDVLHEVDLIEDIAIAYGYDNFTPEIPNISTIGKENSREVLKRKISEILIGLGLLEVSNYHLTKKEDQFSKMGIGEKEEKGFVEVEESKTDYNILRKDLSSYLMKNFSENGDAEYPQKIFEIGKIFELGGNNIFEKESLAVGFAPGNFTSLKQVLDYFGERFGLNFEIKETSNIPWFVPGRVGEIHFEGNKIGLIGEVSPKILKNWKIKMPVGLFEISLEEIFSKV